MFDRTTLARTARVMLRQMSDSEHLATFFTKGQLPSGANNVVPDQDTERFGMSKLLTVEVDGVAVDVSLFVELQARRSPVPPEQPSGKADG